MSAPLAISVRNLAKRWRAADQDVLVFVPELDLPEAGVYAAIGRSGCGKSTLLDMLALVLRPTSCERLLIAPGRGAAPVDARAAWHSRDGTLDRLRATSFGYIVQTGGLLPFLTVEENIALPARLNRSFERARIVELATRLGIAEQLKKRPAQLSVGQRQRVAVARALVHRPAIVFADEPTAALDPDTADTVLRLLLDQAVAAGATLVMASHDLDRVEAWRIPTIRFDIAHERGMVCSVARLHPPVAARAAVAVAGGLA